MSPVHPQDPPMNAALAPSRSASAREHGEPGAVLAEGFARRIGALMLTGSRIS